MSKKLYQVYRVNKAVVPFRKIPIGQPQSEDNAFRMAHLLNRGAVTFTLNGLKLYLIVYQVEEIEAAFGDEEITKP